ncbi:MAG: imidazole glycerol phosphate synthase subunit HisF [Planctomycetes bacterium]|nr:imidazole glycerol phosphate synthase subunit HisF [Planctomycetota bacterium]
MRAKELVRFDTQVRSSYAHWLYYFKKEKKVPEPVKIMPCLDMKEGKVVKGIHFVDLRDAGDPVECARTYCEQGADELAFLDITATVENRKTMLREFSEVAEVSTVPLTLGGGIKSLHDIEGALDAGAEKASMSSAAVRSPDLIEEAAREFGSEHIVVAVDADASGELPSGYEVYIDGGRTATGIDALEFAKAAEDRGAGTILPTSKRTDGTKNGYDIELTGGIADCVKVPVIASGGAGAIEHFYEAATAGKADVLLAASVFHFGEIKIPDLKEYLKDKGVEVF